MVERLLAPTRDDHPCPALEQLARYLKSNPARPASHERALSGNIHRVPKVSQNRYLGIRCLGLFGYNAQCEGIAVTFALFFAVSRTKFRPSVGSAYPRVAKAGEPIAPGRNRRDLGFPKLRSRRIDTKPPKSPYDNGRPRVSVAGPGCRSNISQRDEVQAAS